MMNSNRQNSESNQAEAVDEQWKKDKLRKMTEFRCFLEEEVWPLIPPEHRGKTMSKAEREEILGYGELGFYEH